MEAMKTIFGLTNLCLCWMLVHGDSYFKQVPDVCVPYAETFNSLATGVSWAVPSIIVGKPLGNGSAIICEFSSAMFICPSDQVINITYANFGRKDTCSDGEPPSVSPVTNCISVPGTYEPTDWEQFAEAISHTCQGVSSCNLRAVENYFGDPCSAIYNYLEVEFDCV